MQHDVKHDVNLSYTTSIRGRKMRRFVIMGHRAMTTGDFSLNDLPGSSGRVDVLARSINSAFMLSHDIRRKVEVALVLLGPKDPPKTIRLVGSELKYLNPDERTTSALIRNALVKCSAMKKTRSTNNPELNITKNNKLTGELKASPGIYISDNGLADVLEFYSSNSNLIYLHESSKDLSGFVVKDDLTFILSDDKDFTQEEELLIKKHSTQEISLGPMVYHSDHCITIIHHLLDRSTVES